MDRPTELVQRSGWAERSWPYWLAFFLLVASARIYSTAAYFPHTMDEGAHIAGGVEWLERGVYRLEV